MRVCVTFVDELTAMGDTTVSTVVPDNPAQRTYKIVGRRVNGLAYATAIPEKYGLTYEQLTGRLTL